MPIPLAIKVQFWNWVAVLGLSLIFFFIPYCHIVFLQIERGAFFCSQLVPEEGGEAELLFSGK